MKLVIKREVLAVAAARAAKVAPTRGCRPLLRCVLLNASQTGEVTLQASDSEVSAESLIRAESVDGGAIFCVYAGLLAGLLNELTGELVTMELGGPKTVENPAGLKLSFQFGVLKLTCGRDAFDLCLFPHEDFPALKAFPAAAQLKVKAGALRNALESVAFCAAGEQGRYAINGVFLEPAGSSLHVVATDGRRMAHAKIKTPAPEGVFGDRPGLIMPLRMIAALLELCDSGAEGDDVELAFTENLLQARLGGFVVSGLPVDGIFPKWRQVVPKAESEIPVRVAVLDGELRKAMYFVSDESKSVNLEFSKGGVRVASRSVDKGAAELFADLGGEFEPKEISLNPKYLQEALKASAAESVGLCITDASRPVLMWAKDWECVLMPILAKE